MSKRSTATILLILGTNSVTYGYARSEATESSLSCAEQLMLGFLKDAGVVPAARADLTFPPEKMKDPAILMMQVRDCGGNKYWHNKAVACWALGVGLMLVGLLLPYVKEAAAVAR